MDTKEIVKTVQDLIPSLLEAFPVQKVILYGSWAEGKQDHNSDIDLAIVVRNIHADYLQSLVKLHEICSLFDVRLEPLLFEYDNDPSGFLEHISRYGEVLYVNEDEGANSKLES